MFLEKLEIQGFKSFATKNLLVFPGMLGGDKRGITAIVGPNGSGKSNTADAVRWVLGEQSMKTLRGKKSEDVIFSGSDKKGKLSMAEVSLYLNNEDGKAPVDYSEFVLTRRLFRDGNSEYLINNSRVRLADIQMLLAKASFGQRTYSVIGQGMVEGFLNTSLSERKEFFDEATGVKQYQIKRDDSLNKLLSCYENTHQAQMILSEIEPRLRSLTKQVGKLQRRGELEVELKDLQTIYYRSLWHDINDKLKQFNKEFLALETIKLEKDKKLENLNAKLGQMQSVNQVNQEFVGLQTVLSGLQSEKDGVTKQLAKIEAQLELRLESDGKFDVAWLKNKFGELTAEQKAVLEDARNIEQLVAQEKVQVGLLQAEKVSLNDKIKELNTALLKTSAGIKNHEVKRITEDLKMLFLKLEAAEKQDDNYSLKTVLMEIKTDLESVLKFTNQLSGGESLEAVHAELIALTELREEINVKFTSRNNDLYVQTERMRSLREKGGELSRELHNLEVKLKQQSIKIDYGELGEQQSQKNHELKAIELKIEAIKNELTTHAKKESAERSVLFEIQRQIQAMQLELNVVNKNLSELRIGAARYEAKLEDIETEIRSDFGSLRAIKESRIDADIEISPIIEKIQNIKRQLDQIGGIDPEIENEYIETKSRFDFLAAQIADLEAAIDSLEKIIKELDFVIKEKFDKEFAVISAKFEEYFKILFSGGVAKIIKVMDGEESLKTDVAELAQAGSVAAKDERLLQAESYLRRIKYLQKYNATGLAGIEIQATPPGKKIKSVTMLSGGERALTAIALICAIIHVNPSPFVVLDEVDAALDEANSERLARILDDLSFKTQFIVITHNRASMRKANVLYGVTMGDDGVSKLLSVKLDDVKIEK
ncbi:MAG: AAA family ATPase [bacterium]